MSKFAGGGYHRPERPPGYVAATATFVKQSAARRAAAHAADRAFVRCAVCSLVVYASPDGYRDVDEATLRMVPHPHQPGAILGEVMDEGRDAMDNICGT